MLSIGQKIDDYFARKLLKREPGSSGIVKALEISLLKLTYVIIKGLTDEQLSLRAMSLVYTTLLSFVPLLAVSFSVLKAFGVHTKIEIFLYYFLEPLGTQGIDLSIKIIEFVEKVKIGVLGSLGLSMLIYTVLSTVQKIERSFNYIWNIGGTRSFSQRFSSYLSVLLIGPVLIFSAIGITASLMSSAVMKKIMSVEILWPVFYLGGRVLPYTLVCTAFTFIYLSLPNTKVHFRSALIGGVAAGILWQTTGWIFTSFIASSAQYSAVYSGFAVLILFLIWLYWTFLILFVGAKVSFFHQRPRSLDTGRERFVPEGRLKEKVSMLIMFLIGYNFYHGKHHWTGDALAERLGFPPEFVNDIIVCLIGKGLILPSGDEPPAYLPAKDIESISLKEVIDSVRASRAEFYESGEKLLSLPEVDGIVRQIDKAISASLESETIKGLVLSAKEREEGKTSI